VDPAVAATNRFAMSISFDHHSAPIHPTTPRPVY